MKCVCAETSGGQLDAGGPGQCAPSAGGAGVVGEGVRKARWKDVVCLFEEKVLVRVASGPVTCSVGAGMYALWHSLVRAHRTLVEKKGLIHCLTMTERHTLMQNTGVGVDAGGWVGGRRRQQPKTKAGQCERSQQSASDASVPSPSGSSPAPFQSRAPCHFAVLAVSTQEVKVPVRGCKIGKVQVICPFSEKNKCSSCHRAFSPTLGFNSC